MENQIGATQEIESMKAIKVVTAAISKAKGLNLVPQAAATGVSFFAGKKRLCKVLNTKRGVSLEINVKLSEVVASLPGMESISPAKARKEHLGTMKHMYRAPDASKVSEILADALKAFAKEVAEASKEQVTEAAETEVANA